MLFNIFFLYIFVKVQTISINSTIYDKENTNYNNQNINKNEYYIKNYKGGEIEPE